MMGLRGVLLGLVLGYGYAISVGAADIALNGVPLRLQDDANKVVVTTNVTVNATGNSTETDKARLTVPGSSDIRLQLQPDGLSDGGDASLCQGRKCPSTVAVETLLEEQARTLNSTWDVLVEEPLKRAKDALLLGLSQAWGRLKDGFSDAGSSIKQAANATVRAVADTPTDWFHVTAQRYNVCNTPCPQRRRMLPSRQLGAWEALYKGWSRD